MVQERGRPDPRLSHTEDDPSESTALLNAVDACNTDHEATYQESEGEGSEIDPNEFDNMLSRSESITTGIGVEVGSQETAMLRGPRRYTSQGSRLRKSSQTGIRRKSFGTVGSNEETIQELGEDDSDMDPKSPFLGGVSVTRFWIIFTGVLITYFVSCFDSTLMVSSHPVITSYFHSSNSASWLSTAFLLTSTSFQPLFGRLSDTLGRKGPYVFTMTVFVGATHKVW
jgi:hypothetical protein